MSSSRVSAVHPNSQRSKSSKTSSVLECPDNKCLASIDTHQGLELLHPYSEPMPSDNVNGKSKHEIVPKSDNPPTPHPDSNETQQQQVLPIYTPQLSVEACDKIEYLMLVHQAQLGTGEALEHLPQAPPSEQPNIKQEGSSTEVPAPKLGKTPHTGGSLETSTLSDDSVYTPDTDNTWKKGDYIPCKEDKKEWLWIRKNLMVLFMAMGQLIREANSIRESPILLARNQEFYTSIRPKLFHYKNEVDAAIKLQNKDFVADELPTGFLVLNPFRNNEEEQKALSEESYRKKIDSETSDPWQCFDIQQLLYCWKAVFQYAVLLGIAAMTNSDMSQEEKEHKEDQERCAHLVHFRESMKSCGVAEKHLREPIPNVEKALEKIELAIEQNSKGHIKFNKWMVEKVWKLDMDGATTTKRNTIKPKEGLPFPYYNAADEGMTEVSDFITDSYGLRDFVYDMFLVMAANPRISDDKLPPKFRSLWKQPDQQARVAAEYYEFSLWKQKARTLLSAGPSLPDVFDQVFWHMNDLADDTQTSDINLPLCYRESILEERRRLSSGCTVQAVIFYQELKRVRTDWESLIMKHEWDRKDRFEKILDVLEKRFEHESNQPIELEVLLPPGVCSLEKEPSMKSKEVPERRKSLECWTFNVLKHLVQWLFVQEGWRTQTRNEADTKVHSPIDSNVNISKEGDVMKCALGYVAKKAPCDGRKTCLCEVRKLDPIELVKLDSYTKQT